MLGKLMKYEMKSIYKYFLTLYAIIIIGAIMSLTTARTQVAILEKIGIGSFVACFVACIALGVVQFIFTITRFNTSLLGDEGYLMFTIPTSTHTVIWSKALVLLIFNILSTIVVAGAFVMIFLVSTTVSANKIDPKGIEFIHNVFKYPGVYLGIIVTIVSVLVSIIDMIFLIYASLSFGQLPGLKKHKNIFAFAFFIVFNTASTYLYTVISKDSTQALIDKFETASAQNIDASATTAQMGERVRLVVDFISKLQVGFIVSTVIEIAVLYAITYYILNRKLNLD